MSAYIALCHKDRVELLTDGAQYNAAGIVHGFTEKVTRVAGVPAAITTRGAVGPANTITKIAEKRRSRSPAISTALSMGWPAL